MSEFAHNLVDAASLGSLFALIAIGVAILYTLMSFARGEAVELAVPVALPDTEVEPPAGDQIERRGLLGQQDRLCMAA